MSEKQKYPSIRVAPETRAKLVRLGEEFDRGLGSIVNVLVAEKYHEVFGVDSVDERYYVQRARSVSERDRAVPLGERARAAGWIRALVKRTT